MVKLQDIKMINEILIYDIDTERMIMDAIEIGKKTFEKNQMKEYKKLYQRELREKNNKT